MGDASKPHSSREDLDAEGFGYWPEEAQAAIVRRDERIASLKEQVQSQQEWIDRVAAFSTDAATAADKAEREVESLKEQLEAAMDCMNYAWTIICNVSEGDWTKQNQEWQDAAARCRDQYHALLDSNPASSRKEDQ